MRIDRLCFFTAGLVRAVSERRYLLRVIADIERAIDVCLSRAGAFRRSEKRPMKRLFAILLASPLMIVGETLASVVVLILLFGGILAIGLVVGHNVSYVLATILAIGWAVQVFWLNEAS